MVFLNKRSLRIDLASMANAINFVARTFLISATGGINDFFYLRLDYDETRRERNV